MNLFEILRVGRIYQRAEAAAYSVYRLSLRESVRARVISHAGT